MHNTSQSLIKSNQETTLPERSIKLVQCLEKADGFELAKVEKGLSVEKCLSAPLLVNQKEAHEVLVQSIFIIIKRFNDMVNVGRKMNEDQMIAMSFDLLEKFGSESLEDIMLFFKMARNGDFGDFFRLDSVVVLSWIPKYFDLKTEARELAIENERNARIRAENDAVAAHVPDDVAKENLEKLSRMLKTTTVKRNTGEFRKDNPLFNYQSYLEALQENVVSMELEQLKTMSENTSQRSHPEVFKILAEELEKRNK